jgi:hypothetical protein
LNMHVRLRTHWICIHIGWIQVASMSTRKVLYFKSYLISACVSGLRKRQGHSSWTDQERGGGRHVSLPSSQARPKAKPHYKSRTTYFLLPLMRLRIQDEESNDSTRTRCNVLSMPPSASTLYFAEPQIFKTVTSFSMSESGMPPRSHPSSDYKPMSEANEVIEVSTCHVAEFFAGVGDAMPHEGSHHVHCRQNFRCLARCG